MYDRVDGRVQTVSHAESPSVPSPERREEESVFKESFVLAIKSAMLCPQVAEMLETKHWDQETITVEEILESEKFQTIFRQMIEGFDRYMDEDSKECWAGRRRLFRDTFLMTSAPLILERYCHEERDEDAGGLSESHRARLDERKVRNLCSTLVNGSDKRVGVIPWVMEYGYNVADGSAADPVMGEIQWMVKSFPAKLQTGYVETGAVRTDEKIRERIQSVSAWLLPLMQEWKSAFNDGNSSDSRIMETFFERYAQRYGVPPATDPAHMQSAKEVGKSLFEKDKSMCEYHKLLHVEAEDLLKLLRTRMEKTIASVYAIDARLIDANKDIETWNALLEEDYNKIDQRDVRRYAESSALIKANEAPFRGDGQQSKENERLEFLNTFPDRVESVSEQRARQIKILERNKEKTIENHNSLVGSVIGKAHLRSKVNAYDQQIEWTQQIANKDLDEERKQYVQAMEAAERAEYDKKVLPAERAKLEARLARYREAVKLQWEVVQEEEVFIERWREIYTPRTPSPYSIPGRYSRNDSMPGYYADQAQSAARGY